MILDFENRAEIALRSLRGQSKNAILEALRGLESKTAHEIIDSENSHRVDLKDSAGTLYVYRTQVRLRLILSIEDQRCRVIDIVDHSRLGRLSTGGIKL